jgi:hypothetical protein
MSGPVISATRKALETGNVNLVLIWVQPRDEAAIRAEFARARAARSAGNPERQKVERRFFEALVRAHRIGEGAPYTGIKPEGTDVGPAVTAADRALAAGSEEPVRLVLVNAVQSGIAQQNVKLFLREPLSPRASPRLRRGRLRAPWLAAVSQSPRSRCGRSPC